MIGSCCFYCLWLIGWIGVGVVCGCFSALLLSCSAALLLCWFAALLLCCFAALMLCFPAFLLCCLLLCCSAALLLQATHPPSQPLASAGDAKRKQFTSGTFPFRSEMGVLGGGLSQPLPFPDSRHTYRAFWRTHFFGKNWKKKRTEKTVKNRAVQKLLFSPIFGLSELSLSNFDRFWVNFGTPRTLFFDFFGR